MPTNTPHLAFARPQTKQKLMHELKKTQASSYIQQW